MGFTESTTQLERDLKQVPLQESKERASLLNATLEEIILANTMAPQVEQFCKREGNDSGAVVTKPQTNYMASIIQDYHAKFKVKLARKPRKLRRDCGLAKDPEELRAIRKQQGKPQPEADFRLHFASFKVSWFVVEAWACTV